eukprot:COSAG03_NODE_12498_length_544_cov_1.060674_1_plen_180_part_11
MEVFHGAFMTSGVESAGAAYASLRSQVSAAGGEQNVVAIKTPKTAAFCQGEDLGQVQDMFAYPRNGSSVPWQEEEGCTSRMDVPAQRHLQLTRRDATTERCSCHHQGLKPQPIAGWGTLGGTAETTGVADERLAWRRSRRTWSAAAQCPPLNTGTGLRRVRACEAGPTTKNYSRSTALCS